MPPKKGRKRKGNHVDSSNGDGEPAPPDRATWPGWVEVESEPAFFNVMLKDMGVPGVKIQEVYSLDEDMLAILPQPVHALIFLFRYRDVDEEQSEKGTECPDHVWFANQIPDFACATVALLNIVNNLKGVKLGKELRDFKTFTRNMDPLGRGDAIDSFEFVRKIHNSFARENDLLIADVCARQRAEKTMKRKAAEKARDTKLAKKESKSPARDTATKGTTNGENFRMPAASRRRTNDTAPSVSSSPLSNPPDSDPDFSTPSKRNKTATAENGSKRRSNRQPQPRKDPFAATASVQEKESDEEGFHFIAYMPVAGHVWRMDGLDNFPQDLGAFENGDWMSIAQPTLQTRMAVYEGNDIEFNLMAVVHDPVVKDWESLVENVRTLQEIDRRLDEVFEDWRSLDGAETKSDVVTTSSERFSIGDADLQSAELPAGLKEQLEKDEDLLRLLEMRQQVIREQAQLRGAVRDAKEYSNDDDEKARHRRHDYGTFIREWMGALADQEVLADLLEGVT